MKRIHIVDCGLGNITSVSNAFESLECDIARCSCADQLLDSTLIILPGVGSFSEGVRKLNESGFSTAILSAVQRGCKLLGICLGMQFLFDKSFEFGEHGGLHLIPGEVRKMELSAYNLRIPHIGWNDTMFIQNDPIFNGFNNPTSFYYINSYSCVCANPKHVIAEYEYGDKFTAIVHKDNVYGVQFHPEKSHKEGLKLLKNILTV